MELKNNILYIGIKKSIIFIIKIWRVLLRPFFPPNACRFEPTCSHYAEQALNEHGIIKGILMSAWRILRCNPWNRGGYDPVKKNIGRNC